MLGSSQAQVGKGGTGAIQEKGEEEQPKSLDTGSTQDIVRSTVWRSGPVVPIPEGTILHFAYST
jgi:hypothetical protein